MPIWARCYLQGSWRGWHRAGVEGRVASERVEIAVRSLTREGDMLLLYDADKWSHWQYTKAWQCPEHSDEPVMPDPEPGRSPQPLATIHPLPPIDGD
jgi:hypothetical protein